MRVRCRDSISGRQCTLTLDDATATFGELLSQARHGLELGEAVSLRLKSAVPPFTAIATDTDYAKLLRDVPVRNGDSFVVEVVGAVASAPAASTAAASASPVINTTNAAAPARPPRDASHMRKEPVADDNSCLFNAIGYTNVAEVYMRSSFLTQCYVLLNKDKTQSRQLRQLIADTVRASPDFSEAVLGMSKESYCRTITGTNAWGGAIELAVFAKHFRTEIVCIDVETCKPYFFGEGAGYTQRVYLLYSGIHYDAVALTPGVGVPADFDTTVFESGDESVLRQALALAAVEQKAGRFTNTTTFSLRCSVCRTALVGQKEAQEHCTSTGHTAFEEYSAAK